MPSSAEILAGLTAIANDGRWLAIAWHMALAAVIVALAVGWRPTRRAAATLATFPIASASLMAWIGGNPFNGLLLGAGVVALLILVLRLAPEPVSRPPPWTFAIGAAVLAYGWIYPHFLVAQPAWVYVFAAPVGLVPCPSLSVAIGFAILAGGFGSRPWALVLAALGLFYAAFGTLRLGVWLDLGLLIASVALIVVTCVARTTWPRPVRPVP